jgi:hypothetical protein
VANSKMVSNKVHKLHGDSITRMNILNHISIRRLFIVKIDINLLGANFETSFYDLTPGEEITDVWKDFAVGAREGSVLPRHKNSSAFEIHFGLRPCHVIFALTAGKWKFADDSAVAPDVEETVVFRKNKVVIDYSSGSPVTSVDKYDPNYSFYNMQRESLQWRTRELDVIRFDNYLTMDRRGRSKIASTNDISTFCMDLYLKVPLSEIFGSDGLKFFNQIRNAADAGPDRMPIKFPFTRDNDLIIVFDPPQANGGPIGPP